MRYFHTNGKFVDLHLPRYGYLRETAYQHRLALHGYDLQREPFAAEWCPQGVYRLVGPSGESLGNGDLGVVLVWVVKYTPPQPEPDPAEIGSPDEPDHGAGSWSRYKLKLALDAKNARNR